MRAIITSTVRLGKLDRSDVDGELQNFLALKNWWPALDQQHEFVVKHRDEILETISENDYEITKATILYTIYSEEYRTWGVISKPGTNVITFRLKNPVSDRLKRACEKLVSDCQDIGKKRSEMDIHFKFNTKIEVLEPKGNDHAYFGEILPANRLTLAIKQRRNEFWVGFLAFIVAVILILTTLPPILRIWVSVPPTDWEIWLKGVLERLSSSAVVTATVSLLNVGLHYFSLLRRTVIDWTV